MAGSMCPKIRGWAEMLPPEYDRPALSKFQLYTLCACVTLTCDLFPPKLGHMIRDMHGEQRMYLRQHLGYISQGG